MQKILKTKPSHLAHIHISPGSFFIPTHAHLYASASPSLLFLNIPTALPFITGLRSASALSRSSRSPRCLFRGFDGILGQRARWMKSLLRAGRIHRIFSVEGKRARAFFRAEKCEWGCGISAMSEVVGCKFFEGSFDWVIAKKFFLKVVRVLIVEF